MTESEKSPETHSRIPELDGIRGLAILLVSIFRFTREFDPNGATGWIRSAASATERGVDLFFVLSGFLITLVLLRDKGDDRFLRNFFARRCLRIFPLYIVSLFGFLVLLPNIWHPSHAFPFPEAIQRQAYLWSYTTNLRMCWEREWCFGRFDHFWSLAVEEHYYLLWPFIVAALSRSRLFAFTLVAIGLCAGCRMLYAANSDDEVTPYVLSLFRFDAILIGALLAQIDIAKLPARRVVLLIGFVLIFGVVVGASSLAPGENYFSVVNSVSPMAAAMLILLTLRFPASLVARSLRGKSLRMLGRYSYAMYVFQSPIIPLVALAPGAYPLWQGIAAYSPLLADLGYLIAMFLITVACGWLSWHALEKHFLGLRRHFLGSGRTKRV